MWISSTLPHRTRLPLFHCIPTGGETNTHPWPVHGGRPSLAVAPVAGLCPPSCRSPTPASQSHPLPPSHTRSTSRSRRSPATQRRRSLVAAPPFRLHCRRMPLPFAITAGGRPAPALPRTAPPSYPLTPACSLAMSGNPPPSGHGGARARHARR